MLAKAVANFSKAALMWRLEISTKCFGNSLVCTDYIRLIQLLIIRSLTLVNAACFTALFDFDLILLEPKLLLYNMYSITYLQFY